MSSYTIQETPEFRGEHIYTEGHWTEENLVKTAVKLGVKEVDHSMVGSKLDYVAICMATEEEDAAGTDIHFYNPKIGWQKLAITISKNKENRERKKEQALKQGTVYMQFNPRTLDRAARGAEKDQEIFAYNFTSQLKHAQETESQEAITQLSSQPLPV